MAEAVVKPKSLKAQITRTSLVLAAAALLREEGPSSVTYRRVAKWAGAASSSVGYYFNSTPQLLGEAAQYNMQLWTQRARGVAEEAEALSTEECRENVVDLLMRALLPDESTQLSAHYTQLLMVEDSSSVTEEYHKGRVSLESSAERIMRHAGVKVASDFVTILIDGTVVQAISEGRDARAYVAEVLGRFIASFA